MIDRASFDALIDNQAALASSVRGGPEMVDGKMVGVKLAFVRPGSVLDKLGLHTGDRLTKINGAELTSPERILELYARLRTAPRFAFEVVRGGAAMQIDYEVR